MHLHPAQESSYFAGGLIADEAKLGPPRKKTIENTILPAYNNIRMGTHNILPLAAFA